MPESADLPQLLAQAAAGDETALTQLFSRYRKRLKQMVRLRLSRQLQGRVDDSDILQEAFLEAAQRFPDYLADRPLPFFLWLRHITGEKLIDAHRRHLGAQMRDAAQEVSLRRRRRPSRRRRGSAYRRCLTGWTRLTGKSWRCAILNSLPMPRWLRRWR